MLLSDVTPETKLLGVSYRCMRVLFCPLTHLKWTLFSNVGKDEAVNTIIENLKNYPELKSRLVISNTKPKVSVTRMYGRQVLAARLDFNGTRKYRTLDYAIDAFNVRQNLSSLGLCYTHLSV